MAQVFSRSSNAIARISILGGVVVAGLLATVAYLLVRSPYATGAHNPIPQPVPFSHAHHVGGDGIDCRYCHTSVEKSSYANIPPTQTCMNCHSQIWTNSPNTAPIRESWQTGQPIVWNKVNQLPQFVFFNHSIHIAKGIGCSTCHGRVDEMQITWQAAPLNMLWCLNCHTHPEKYVRPKDQIYNMAWQPPSNQIQLGHELVKEYGIERKVSCSICHR